MTGMTAHERRPTWWSLTSGSCLGLSWMRRLWRLWVTLEGLWHSFELKYCRQCLIRSQSFLSLSPQLKEDPTVKRVDLDEDHVIIYLDGVSVLDLFKYLEGLETFLGWIAEIDTIYTIFLYEIKSTLFTYCNILTHLFLFIILHQNVLFNFWQRW